MIALKGLDMSLTMEYQMWLCKFFTNSIIKFLLRLEIDALKVVVKITSRRKSSMSSISV